MSVPRQPVRSSRVTMADGSRTRVDVAEKPLRGLDNIGEQRFYVVLDGERLGQIDSEQGRWMIRIRRGTKAHPATFSQRSDAIAALVPGSRVAAPRWAAFTGHPRRHLVSVLDDAAICGTRASSPWRSNTTKLRCPNCVAIERKALSSIPRTVSA